MRKAVALEGEPRADEVAQDRSAQLQTEERLEVCQIAFAVASDVGETRGVAADETSAVNSSTGHVAHAFVSVRITREWLKKAVSHSEICQRNGETR